MNNDTPNNAGRKVSIYQPHTHAGKRLVPGADGIELEVSVADAKFLESIGATRRPGVLPEVPPAATDGGTRPQA